MRRLLLFLLLAGAGLGALALGAGGFLGKGRRDPRPEVPSGDPAEGSSEGQPVRLSELPLPTAGVKAPDAAVRPLERLTWTPARDREWVDPVTGERVPLPFFHELALEIARLETFRDEVTGAAGERWREVRLTVYREPSLLTREEATRLAADPAARKDLVLYEVEAHRGKANWQLAPLSDGAEPPAIRTVVRLDGDVRIRLVREGLLIRTSDVTIDREAGTAEGPGPILVEGSGILARGRGFRLDRTARRIDVLSEPELDLRGTEEGTAGAATPFDLGTGSFRPRVVRAKGGATIVQRDDDRGRPLLECVLREGVVAEGEAGSRLACDLLEVQALREASTRGDDGPPGASRRLRLSRVVAEGSVSGESGSRTETGRARVASLRVDTVKLTSLFEGRRVERLLLEGRTTVRWLGELSMPGGRKAVGRLFATCRDRLSFGPPPAAAPEAATCDAMLDLLGSARVESDAVAPGEPPESVEAERLQLFLRRGPASSTATGVPWDDAGLVAVAFAATGGDVRVAGPRVSGTAREVRGTGLDLPTWRLVATGSDARFEVTEDAVLQGPRAGAAAQGAAGPTKPRRRWDIDSLEAEAGVRGEMTPAPGVGAVRFSGETLRYRRAEGGALHGTSDRPASLAQADASGHESTLEAPTVGFRWEAREGLLWTRGGTKAVLWTDAGTASAPSSSGARRVSLRSGARIELSGGVDPSDSATTITVRATDDAALEAKSGDLATDRVAAREIVAVLAERAPRPAGAAWTSRPQGSHSARASSPGPAVQRWSVACEDLEVRTGGAAGASERAPLRSVEAKGGVTATADGGAQGGVRRFEGTRLVFDGSSGTGRLEGSEAARARITQGLGDLAQHLAAARVDFATAGASLSRAEFAPPVTGVFHASEPRSGGLQRYSVHSASHPLVVEGSTARIVASAEDPVVVTRSSRAGPDGAFRRDLSLAAPRLDLSGPAAALASGVSGRVAFSASGPGTRVEVLQGGRGPTRAQGDRLEYDPERGRLRMTGTNGVRLSQEGEGARPARGRVNWVEVDLATGAVDTEGGDFVWGLGR